MMQDAISTAKVTMNKNCGGPFGAVIVDKDNNIVAIASNTVLSTKDPTAHAEINAIREASMILDTYDLSGCKIYTTGYPCPMCISAIIWANIHEVFYGTNLDDAEKIGFRDDFIYDFIRGDNKSVLEMHQLDHDHCLELFNEYDKKNKTIY